MKKYLIIFIAFANISIFSQGYSLLLGIGYQDDYMIGDSSIDIGYMQYLRTICLTTEDDSLKIIADIPEIILPRDTSYWRIGIKRSIYNEWTQDFYWVCPLEDKPKIEGIDAETGETCEGSDEYSIEYVNKNYIIIYNSGGGYCEGAAHPSGYFNYYWVPIDKLGSSYNWLGEIALNMPNDLIKIFGKQFYKNFLKDGKSAYDTLNNRTKSALEHIPSRIYPYREKGKWHCEGQYYWGYEAVRGITTEFDVTQLPPSSFFEEDTLTVPWDTISTYFPTASDAFTSPDSKILVVNSDAGLSFYKIVDQRIILTSAIEYETKGLGINVIMIKWYKKNKKTDSFFRKLSNDFWGYQINVSIF